MNIFKQFYKSIYSPKDIATFRNQGIGKTILYLVFLALIAVLPLFITFVQISNNVYDSVKSTIQDIPDFEINNGELISEIKDPITIDSSDVAPIIFDSTGSLTLEEVEYKSNNTIAILQEEIVFRFDGQTNYFKYSDLRMGSVTKSEIEQFLTMIEPMKSITYIISFILFYLIEIAGNIITVTVLALFGLLLKGKSQINYGHSWKLSAYAMTLATVFFTIMNFFHAFVPFANFINWGVMLIMLYLSIKEITKVNQKIV